VRFENRSTTLTLAPNNATHGKLAVGQVLTKNKHRCTAFAAGRPLYNSLLARLLRHIIPHCH
jgi:hypothetical protein